MRNLQPKRQHWVEQWQDSGLTAEAFGARHGLNPGTLRYWKYSLKRHPQAPSASPHTTRAQQGLPPQVEAALPLVELRTTTVLKSAPFELELFPGRWLRVPAGFDKESLRSLLQLLEQRP